ncbi:hypothetical protein CAPN001_13100 [Capnocytophaga stomatis]|nr:hypothetical protein [Capnocytophaga stomatis]GIJ93981.1 hypothetical protein CAPN002_11990 [Capnocytophaga stomatis]GIJ96741.1 hypothetical protein CAPN001_13100 [Capnocytophaga stomatis]GIM48627.1 hypothetical protein CAPN003_00790 [Capnocytophaga stomatis]
MNNKIQIATNIPTEIFYKIVDYLKENSWKLIAEYSPEIFDKAIDFDLYQFEKENETIQMIWDIWFEGEIKATPFVFKMLSSHLKYEFKYETSIHFHEDIFIKKSSLLMKY